jgi:FkbM family methyltransferase
MNYLLAQNMYGKYAVPISSKHRPASQAVIAGKPYEPDTIKFMVDNCGQGTIIHAGTFFGDFLPALIATGNLIYAFEPMLENYEHAVETVKLNFNNMPENLVLLNMGLGDVEEQRALMFLDNMNNYLGGMSRYVYSENLVKPSQLQPTTVTRLDIVVKDHSDVSILQLDVEGFEERALMGAIDIITKSKPILILECWDKSMFYSDFFQNEIFSLGYRRDKNLHDNAVLSIEYK